MGRTLGRWRYQDRVRRSLLFIYKSYVDEALRCAFLVPFVPGKMQLYTRINQSRRQVGRNDMSCEKRLVVSMGLSFVPLPLVSFHCIPKREFLIEVQAERKVKPSMSKAFEGPIFTGSASFILDERCKVSRVWLDRQRALKRTTGNS